MGLPGRHVSGAAVAAAGPLAARAASLGCPVGETWDVLVVGGIAAAILGAQLGWHGARQAAEVKSYLAGAHREYDVPRVPAERSAVTQALGGPVA